MHVCVYVYRYICKTEFNPKNNLINLALRAHLKDRGTSM
jgi:hypothetical protein